MNIILVKEEGDWWYHCGHDRRYRDRDLADRLSMSSAISRSTELQRRMPKAEITIIDDDNGDWMPFDLSKALSGE